jgi:7-cyano-7-deazaguanine synthase
MKELAVILVSGGIDSCVTVAIANQEYRLAFLHVNYGQLTESKELDSFSKIADFYDVELRLVCDFGWMGKIGGSSLTDPGIAMAATPHSDADHKLIPATYVPFRNTNLLSAAVAWAEVIQARKVFIGAVAQDGPHYPDTRPEFYKAYNELVRLGTSPDTDIKVETPVVSMQKREVVRLGTELNAPLHLTWSCYKNNDLGCGECESCLNRIEAFKLAEIKDPICYA